MSEPQISALLAFASDLGYNLTGTGEHVTRSDGEVVTRLALLRFGETLESGWLVKTTQAIFINGVALDYQTFFDQNGGLIQSTLDGSLTYWGNWSADNPGLGLEGINTSYEGCLLRCGVKEAQNLMLSKVSTTWSLISAVKNCAVCLDVSTDGGSKECIKCVASAAKICGAAIPLASESAIEALLLMNKHGTKGGSLENEAVTHE